MNISASKVLFLCFVLIAAKAEASVCTDSISETDSTTSQVAMSAGTIVGVVVAEVATTDPTITFIGSQIGCEYGKQFAEAWKKDKAALIIYGNMFVFAEMPSSKETGQYFIQFLGKVGEKGTAAMEGEKIRVSDVAVTPTLVAASEVAKLAEKNGIDGKHAAAVILLVNPTQSAIEIFTGEGFKNTVDQAGKDIENGAKKICGKLC